MKKWYWSLAAMLLTGSTVADSLEGVDRMVCSVAQIQLCVEYDRCYPAAAADLGVPDFVVIDMKKQTISTTKASQLNRSTAFNDVTRENGLLMLQGRENQRAFSFVIEEAKGRMTVAVSRDGITVSAFGSCTDTNL